MKNYFKQEGLKDYLLRQEVIDPNAQPTITYSVPKQQRVKRSCFLSPQDRE